MTNSQTNQCITQFQLKNVYEVTFRTEGGKLDKRLLPGEKLEINFNFPVIDGDPIKEVVHIKKIEKLHTFVSLQNDIQEATNLLNVLFFATGEMEDLQERVKARPDDIKLQLYNFGEDNYSVESGINSVIEKLESAKKKISDNLDYIEQIEIK